MADLVGKISARTYYDYFPPAPHAPGDIWMHLPTHGLLRRERCSAIVVTPSCDLSNRKVNTITYLPIIGCREWMASREFNGEIIGAMLSLIDQLGPVGISNGSALEGPETFSSDLANQVVQLRETLKDQDLNKSLRGAVQRYVAGANHLKRVCDGETIDVRDIETCLSKRRWSQIRVNIVTNAFRQDLYLLPADGNDDVDISPVNQHSVVLFRCPLTVPVSVLDTAQDMSMDDWPSATTLLSKEDPMAPAFADKRPLKALRLQNRFLADLLTKFVALYSRLGSPDFTRTTIETLSEELGAFE
jgi:hypothetical protein